MRRAGRDPASDRRAPGVPLRVLYLLSGAVVTIRASDIAANDFTCVALREDAQEGASISYSLPDVRRISPHRDAVIWNLTAAVPRGRASCCACATDQ